MGRELCVTYNKIGKKLGAAVESERTETDREKFDADFQLEKPLPARVWLGSWVIPARALYKCSSSHTTSVPWSVVPRGATADPARPAPRTSIPVERPLRPASETPPHPEPPDSVKPLHRRPPRTPKRRSRRPPGRFPRKVQPPDAPAFPPLTHPSLIYSKRFAEE